MSSLEDRARAAKENLEGANPAGPAGEPKSVAERKRIPMTLPQQRLAVPEIPGFHLYWMRGTPERISQALAAGYEYVSPEEVKLNDMSLGGDGLKGGNTDLGDRVSRLAAPTGGDFAPDGQPVRLVLMKQKLEWYEEDQKILQNRNDSVVEALTAQFQTGMVGGRADGESETDARNRYVDTDRSYTGTAVPKLRTRSPRQGAMPEVYRRKG